MRAAHYYGHFALGTVITLSIMVFAWAAVGASTTSSSLSSLSKPKPFGDDAFWIWAEDDEPHRHSTAAAANTSNNTWMMLQTTVPLVTFSSSSSSPHVRRLKFQANIAVDSKYWLWLLPAEACHDNTLNNLTMDWDSPHLLVREGGLKRGPTPHDTWYDTVNVNTEFEFNDNNNDHDDNRHLCLRVLVWYWGRDGTSHIDSGRGGLLMDGTLQDQDHLHPSSKVHIVTDSMTWTTLKHPSFQTDPKKAFGNRRLSESNIYYDASLLDTHNMDDTVQVWRPALQIGPAGTAPWNQLYFRPVPQWKDHELSPYKFVHYGMIDDAKTLVVHAELPYNMAFLPWIQFPSSTTPSGLRVEIQTDNYFLDHRPNDTYLRATYITRAGSQTFESPSWLNGHNVTYRIVHPGNTTRTVLRPVVKFRRTHYNTQLVGKFESSDEFYNKLWIKARRTLLLNMRDTFTDCPDRERAQWWGDTAVDLGQVVYSMEYSSASKLIRKAILDLVQWQSSSVDDGDLPQCHKLYSPIPNVLFTNELPIQMLSAIGWYGIFYYYLTSDDKDTILTAYPHVSSYLRNCWTFNSTTGLVNHRHGGWDWADWETNIDAPLLDNAWYALALKAAIALAEVTGHDEDVDLWNIQLSSIQANFDKAFWSGDAYISRGHQAANRAADDRGNAMAVLADLVPSTDRYSKLLKVLTSQYWASSYMEKYVLEALFVMKEPDAALQRMKIRYHDMVMHPHISTLWEYWNLTKGTYNHAWTGGPLTLLSQFVAGVAPTSQGWKTFHVLPQLGLNLSHVKATVPIFNDGHDDVIDVSIKKTDFRGGQACHFEMSVSIPEGISGSLGIPTSIRTLKRDCPLVSVSTDNSIILWRFHEGSNATRLLAKKAGLQFEGEHDGYLRWSAPPGTWSFVGLGECSPVVTMGMG